MLLFYQVVHKLPTRYLCHALGEFSSANIFTYFKFQVLKLKNRHQNEKAQAQRPSSLAHTFDSGFSSLL